MSSRPESRRRRAAPSGAPLPIRHARQHRFLAFIVAAALAAALGVLSSFFLLRGPDPLFALLPSESTAAVVHFRPGAMESWAPMPPVLTARAEALRRALEGALGGSDTHLPTRHTGYGLARQGEASVAFSFAELQEDPSVVRSDDARVVGGFIFFSESPEFLRALDPPEGLRLIDLQGFRDAWRALPKDRFFLIAVQPRLLALPGLPLATSDRDALAAAAPYIGDTPLFLGAGHAHAGANAVSIAGAGSPNIGNAVLRTPASGSYVAVASPGRLLDASASPAARALALQGLGSDPVRRLLLGVDGFTFVPDDGGWTIAAQRPIGWELDREALLRLATDRLRSDLATARALPLADGSTGRDLVGPTDAEMRITEEAGVWSARVDDAYIAVRTDGPSLLVRRGRGEVAYPLFSPSSPRLLDLRLPALFGSMRIEAATDGGIDLLRATFENPRS